jgi:dihydrofolate reductase
MSKLRVHTFSISLDGYGAGPNQDLNNPLGIGGVALHEWVYATKTFREMLGGGGGATGVDDDFAARGLANIGAWIIGRNMFGPVRGRWPDDTWKAWWSEIHHTTPPCSCSPTMPVHRSPWTGAPPFISSRMAFRRP